MSNLSFAYETQSAAVDEAATKAIELVRELSERDPRDADEANPWRNPDQVLCELDQARTRVREAWNELEMAMDQTDTKKANGEEVKEQDLRAAYIDMITDAFADVLEDWRKNEQDVDVDILVDCLQSGLDLMSGEEKEFFMQDNSEEIVDDESITPHEMRRRQLGFNVEVPSA